MKFTKEISVEFKPEDFTLEFQTEMREGELISLTAYKNITASLVNEDGELFTCGIDIEVDRNDIDIYLCTEYGSIEEATKLHNEIKQSIYNKVEDMLEEEAACREEYISDILSES